MIKKEYRRPELSLVRITLREVILSSVEDLHSHLDNGEVPDNPIIDDPDDPIIW